jgi:hypothetical protein
MADEQDTRLSGNPITAMEDSRQSTIGPQYPYGRGPSGQITGQEVGDVFEGFAEDEQRALENELAERRKQIVRVERQLEIGPLCAPTHDTFGGYKAIHDFGLEGETGSFPIQFDPHRFGVFDGNVCFKFEGDKELAGPLSNTQHQDYEKHASLRRNVAILRNFLYVHYFGKNGYQPFLESDRKAKEKIEDMAQCLGEGLKNSVTWNPFSHMMNPLDIEEASNPDQGAVYMYNYLLRLQEKRSSMTDSINPLNWSTLPSSYWELPPIEQSPFAPIYMKMEQLGIEPFIDYTPDSLGEKLANLGVQLDFTRAQLRAPDQLSKPVRDESIYLARKILDNFRILAGTNPRNSNLAVNEADEMQQIERIYDVAIVYKDKYCQLVNQYPDLVNNQAFMVANDAMSKLTYLVKLQALEELDKEGNTSRSQLMAELMDRIPPHHRPQPGETFTKLMSRLEAGLEEAARLRGIAPRMVTNQQSVATVVNAAQEKQKIEQQGHLDVTKLLQQAADKNKLHAAPAMGADADVSKLLSSMQTEQGRKLALEMQAKLPGNDTRIVQANHPTVKQMTQDTYRRQEEIRRANLETETQQLAGVTKQ